MIGKTVLEALGPRGTLVNVARGSAVDETALVAALRDARLGAAALDVYARSRPMPHRRSCRSTTSCSHRTSRARARRMKHT
ncbi:NAD(P)-dependent oxidoreductase [Paraburkholderia sp. RAU2J]|uniref:NAD(P)-dependent oxidoreductase n=1 Tax=Paraburkholderia sp. RAU2J TaxID=1938810 RepID=UPI001F53EF44|nr:NAD(P)-dependent oxidoreductase [Paraburkholderia sp. RAU2J]